MKLDKIHKLHKVAPKGSGSRYAWNGARYRSLAPFLDRKGGEPIDAPALEVTDGRILARVPVEPDGLDGTNGLEPDADGALVPREALEAAARVKAPHALLHVNGTAELIATTRSGAPDLAGPRTTFPLLEGEFPRTDAVVPSKLDRETAPRVRIGFDVRNLRNLADALGTDILFLELPEPEPVRVTDPETGEERSEPGPIDGRRSGPVLAFPGVCGAGFGVIMPVSID